MTAFGFRQESGSPEWMIFRAEVKSIRGARQWASRRGFQWLLVEMTRKKHVGLFRSGGGWLEIMNDPFNAVPTSLIVSHKNGHIDKQATLSALQEYART